MTAGRTVLLALVAGAAGVVLGRALPHESARTVPLAPSSPPAENCRALRSELLSTRAQLGICRAYRASPEEPSTSPPDRSAGAPDRDPLAEAAVDARRIARLEESLPEWVEVLRRDGTIGVYRPEDWPIDSDEGRVLARKFRDGRVGVYAGPDAGPPSDPAAFVRPRDLVGPDGGVLVDGRTKLVLPPRSTP